MITKFKVNESEDVKNISDSDIKKKDSLYSDERGFDKKNKLNRSDKIVPKEILDQIEKGITIEQLEDIDLPVFKYRTQITIHGIFGELTQQRIGGYKHLFQNKNLSIGVKWNAIDYKKKRLIYQVMSHTGFGISHSSNDYYAHRLKVYKEEHVKELKEIYDKIDDSLFIGTKNLYVADIPWIGKMVGLDVRIQSIKEADIWTFLEKSFNVSENDWGVVTAQKEKERKERDAEWDKKRELRDAEEGEKLEAQLAEYKEKYNVVTFEDIPSEDCIMSYLKKGSYRNEILIKKYSDKYDKAKYQVMGVGQSWDKGQSKDDINQRLRKFDRKEESVEKLMSQHTVFILKTFKGTGKKKITSSPKLKTQSSTIPTDLNLVDYSDKAIALFGNTKPLYDHLKAAGGRWNRFIVNPKSQVKGGWIFPKSKRVAVENILKSF